MSNSKACSIRPDRMLNTFGGVWRMVLNIVLILGYFQERIRYQQQVVRRGGVSWTLADAELEEAFLNPKVQDAERYSELFKYLVTGAMGFRSKDGAHVFYPGAASTHGSAIDAMEGFCRTLPMISAWICSGRPTVIPGYDGQDIDLLEYAMLGLLAGTNPKSKGYWGHIRDRDQRIVEAADIALSVWLLRTHLWPQFTSSQKAMIAEWLLSVNGKAIPDNNWHLFPILINETLLSLGCSGNQAHSMQHYARLKSFYLGDGWFSDGPNGAIDYYNAWCIHYSLFWISEINPQFDPDFINRSLDDFVRNYVYFFSTDGIPITGRSICYRMAAPVPLIAAATRKLPNMSCGMARRALDCVWTYFIQRGSVCSGRITQGYWQDDLALLDNYSGPGSSMWSTRSLTLAFYNPPHACLWTAQLENLPIEQDDFKVYIPKINWEIRGVKLTREIRIVKLANAGNCPQCLANPSLVNRLLINILRLPYRSVNKFNAYELHQYSSLHPYWLTESQKTYFGVGKDIPR